MTISFVIKNRFTGLAQFTAQIECNENAPRGAKVALAVQWAYLTGAYLTGADLTGAYLTGPYLTGANLTKANLTGADLTGADLTGAYLTRADLTGAYLTEANLTEADLTGAYLSRADLTRANLTEANLTRANLTGANIEHHTLSRKISQVHRDDGYCFFGFALAEGGILIRAGCRTMLIAEYRDHVAKQYPGTDKAKETLAILASIESRYHK